MKSVKNRNIGILYAIFGVCVLSFDTVLVRLIDRSPWTLVFWRGVFLSCTIALVAFFSSRQTCKKDSLNLTLIDIVGGVAFAASTLFFVLSVNHTDATSTLAIFNTAPLFAAIFAFVLMKEKIAIHTAFAMIGAILGVFYIFQYDLGGGQIQGDYYALFAAINSAIYLVSLRKNKGNNSYSILIIGGITLAVFSLLNGAEPSSLNQDNLIYMIILGCIVVPLSAILIAKSSNYLPTAQTALILLLELLLGPLWVFIILNDQPAHSSLVGGSIVFLSLVLHTLWERHLELNSKFKPTILETAVNYSEKNDTVK